MRFEYGISAYEPICRTNFSLIALSGARRRMSMPRQVYRAIAAPISGHSINSLSPFFNITIMGD